MLILSHSERDIVKYFKYSLFFTPTFGSWSTMILQPLKLTLCTYPPQVVLMNIDNMLAEVSGIFSPVQEYIMTLYLKTLTNENIVQYLETLMR